MTDGFNAAFGIGEQQSELEFSVMMSYVMSLALSLSLFGFTAFHSYLILVNRSSKYFHDQLVLLYSGLCVGQL